MEHIGSGIPRMRKEMHDAGLSEPVYDTDGMFTVTLHRPSNYKTVELTDLQSEVIQTVKTNPSLTMEQIGKAIGIGRTSIYKIVKSLKDIGVLEHKGRKSDGKWVVKNS